MVIQQVLPQKFNMSTTIRLFYYYNGHHTILIRKIYLFSFIPFGAKYTIFHHGD